MEPHYQGLDIETIERYEYFSKKWSEIYGQFKKDTEKLITEAGGKEKLFVQIPENDIYKFILCLR